MSQATSVYLTSHYDWKVAPGQIYPTADVLSAYTVVLETLSRPGAPVILPSHATRRAADGSLTGADTPPAS